MNNRRFAALIAIILSGLFLGLFFLEPKTPLSSPAKQWWWNIH